MIDFVKFAKGVTELMWDEGQPDLDNGSVQELAEECGIITYRKPTQAEIADPDWWGHAEGIKADDQSVGELSPEFSSMAKNAAA